METEPGSIGRAVRAPARTAGYLVAAAYFAMALPVITAAIHLNPSGVPPPSPFDSGLVPSAIAVSVGAVMFAGYAIVLLARGSALFVGAAIAVMTAEWGFTIALGSLHQDYSVHWLQVVVAILFVLDTRLDRLVSARALREASRGLFAVSVMLAFAYCAWLIVVGHGIVARQEPRLVESIWYNSYNLAALPFIAVGVVRLKTAGYRSVRLAPRGFAVDGRDFSGYLGTVNGVMAREFIKNAGTGINCATLAGSVDRELSSSDGLSADADRADPMDSMDPKDPKDAASPATDRDGAPCAARPGERPDISAEACARCVEEPLKATGCRTYRRIYKRVNDIRKLLEALEIGTILNPDNKMKVVERGWKLRLFDDVRVSDADYRRAPSGGDGSRS